jgi:hypothetical protein
LTDERGSSPRRAGRPSGRAASVARIGIAGDTIDAETPGYEFRPTDGRDAGPPLEQVYVLVWVAVQVEQADDPAGLFDDVLPWRAHDLLLPNAGLGCLGKWRCRLRDFR